MVLPVYILELPVVCYGNYAGRYPSSATALSPEPITGTDQQPFQKPEVSAGFGSFKQSLCCK
jgi:hypothetical protein